MSGQSQSDGKNLKDIYLNQKYLDQNPTWHTEDSPWKAKQIQKILSQNKIIPQTVAEVGCGAGEILKNLSSIYETTQFFGYELSPQAFELCQAIANDQIKYFMLNLLDLDLYFDVLLCIDVFEHVEDYMGFLRGLRQKSTYQVFHIPLEITISAILRNTMISSRDSVGHLHYFTKETALAALKDSGYEIIDFFYTPSFDDLPSKTLKSKMAKIPRKLLYTLSPELMVKLLGGCSLIVLCKSQTT
jgi:hypothetical protein